MNGKCLSMVVLVAAAGTLLGLNSCAHDQQLVSIEVQPTVETVGTTSTPVPDDAGFQVQLRALGNYIHPPVTKDLTNQVTWASNTVQMFTVDSTGLLTATGESCGGTLVSATVRTNSSAGGIGSSGAVVTGYMNANVVCYTGSGGGGNTDALTVTFSTGGSGTVVSNPGGASCTSPGPCVGPFTPGTTVTLTATGTNGSNFVSWVGCDTVGDVNPCSVTMTGNRTVTVTFQ